MKIKVVPNQVEFENDPNKSLLQLCHENGVHINSLCKGQPKCAECRVKIVQGEHNVIPPNAVELAVLGNNYYLDGRRLSCQVRAYGDVTIDVSEQIDREQNAHKKVRGFRPKDKTHQSHAVLDTLILQDKPAEKLTEKLADKPNEKPVEKNNNDRAAHGKPTGDKKPNPGRGGHNQSRRR